MEIAKRQAGEVECRSPGTLKKSLLTRVTCLSRNSEIAIRKFKLQRLVSVAQTEKIDIATFSLEIQPKHLSRNPHL